MFYRFITALIAVGCLAGTCRAATAYLGVDGRNTLQGTVANAIIADGEGLDWTSAVLLVNLTSGSVHNDSTFGVDVPVPFFWDLVPGLEWDTWFGVDVDNDPGNSEPIGNGIAGGAGDLGDPVFSTSGQKISVTWFNTETSDTGPTRIANFTLSADAQGTFQLIAGFEGGLLIQRSGTLEGGALLNGTPLPPPWPEPGTVVLIGIGATALLTRR